VDEAGAVHHLDDGEHVRVAPSMDEPSEPIRIGWDRSEVDDRPVAGAGVPVECVCG